MVERKVRALAGLSTRNRHQYQIHVGSDSPRACRWGPSWAGGRLAPEVWTLGTDRDFVRAPSDKAAGE